MTAADRFAQARPRLLRLAYSELGDVGEAEDVVQDAWLRLERADAEAIENLDGWLTTVVARLALDRLRSARARRETSAAKLLARANRVSLETTTVWLNGAPAGQVEVDGEPTAKPRGGGRESHTDLRDEKPAKADADW